MSALTATECYAIRGVTMIDTIDSDTGLTHIYCRTLERVCQEHPTAERMTIEEFCQSKGAAQDTPISWEAISEERYNEMLEVLPPALWIGTWFLVGEPWDHHALSGRARYQAFRHSNGTYQQSRRPITKDEFRRLCHE